MLNDVVGIKDIMYLFNGADELEAIYLHEPEGIASADIPFPLAREILSAALALHCELGTPPPDTLFPMLPLFDKDAITPIKRMSNLEEVIPFWEIPSVRELSSTYSHKSDTSSNRKPRKREE